MLFLEKKINKLHYLIVVMGSIIALYGGVQLGRVIEAENLNMIIASLGGNLSSRSTSIHFGGGGNNYPGAFIIDSIEVLGSGQAVNVTFNNTTLSCTRKVNGYYFTSARGLRLWPLSDNSHSILNTVDTSYNDLSMTGGLYTSCINHPRAIVGYISYSNNSNSLGSIIFGSQTNVLNNSYEPIYQETGIILDNFNTPKGFFYDSIVGVGELDGTGSDLGSSFWNIAVQGRIGISKVVDNDERTTLKESSGRKSIVYTSNEATTSKIINTVLKNSQSYCRGGEKINNLENLGNSKTICYENNQSDSITISGPIANRLKGKDLIVKNQDVIIDKSAFGKPLSIFIDKGNLLIDNNISNSDLHNFDGNGYMTTNTGETQGIYLQGNYIVNGLILGTTNNAYSPIDAKTFIHGKLTSLSLPSTSYTKREQQIESLFGSEKFNIMKGFISLQDVFKRKCNTTTGLGIEGGTNSSIAKNIACGSNIDKHRSSSLIVVEKDYPTTLLK